MQTTNSYGKGKTRSVRWPWRKLRESRPKRSTTPVLVPKTSSSARCLQYVRTWMSLCLATCIASCAHEGPVQTREIVRRVLPPEEFTRQWTQPELLGQHTRDLKNVWHATALQLDNCNSNAAALAVWMTTEESNNGGDRRTEGEVSKPAR